MPTVLDVITRLFPEGTIPGAGPGQVDRLPSWPPDTFATAAKLVDLSGCYAHPQSAGGGPNSIFLSWPGGHSAYLQHVKKTAAAWLAGTLTEVQALWDILLSHGSLEVSDQGAQGAQDWRRAALLLLVIADEACLGAGFVDPSPDDGYPTIIADFLLSEHRKLLSGTGTLLPAPQTTLCLQIPASELCVQPKTITAQAGCTIRSLSHHLALLPGVGEVTTRWLFGNHPSESSTGALNLLAVPFPYRITGACFERGPSCAGYHSRDNKANFFTLRQDWLNPKKITGFTLTAFIEFLRKLIEEARREVHAVHGLILPELSLDEATVEAIAKELAKEPDMELFIAGVSRPARWPADGPRNSVFGGSFLKGELYHWWQNKHHRWKLERSQIVRYHLGNSLEPDENWWEQIDMSRRECVFRVIRHGTSLAALVCEDLARIDPVQTVIRAVGPNLVVALLMDGPQLEKRWPGRYATVLADDPGSAVITLSSYGLMRRQDVRPGEQEPRTIALWKDSRGETRELKLVRGAHALLLTLSYESASNSTLDGRSDDGATIQLFLSGYQGITHPGEVPAWARTD